MPGPCLPEQHKSATVLIVDDEPANLHLLSETLTAQYSVIAAKSGEQALKRLESNSVDLILLDVEMPGMDGYQVIREIKNHADTQHIPVIFVTAKTEAEQEVLGLQLGAVDYISKPFQSEVVLARIHTQIQLKRKTEMLERLALVDGLTNLANRRRFDLVHVDEWKRAERSGNPITLIMADVDHFKQFNDKAGHTAGDQCLYRVANALQRSMGRPGDLVARYGGEEFAIIAPNTPIQGAEVLARRCVERVAALALPHPQSSVSDYVTLSVGAVCAQSTEHLLPPEVMLSLADQCLYRAKAAGRNGFIVEAVERKEAAS